MWLVWDTKKGRHLFGATKGQRRPFLFFTLVSWLADEWSSPQTRHCENRSPWRKLHKSYVYPSLPEQQTLRECFKVELRLLTDVDSSHFPLARHTSLQIHKHTYRDSLYHCGFLRTHNTPTTMTWRGLHHAGAYIYSTAIYPWALTTHRLCHCGVTGAPLPVCLSICLSSLSQKWQKWMANDWLSDDPASQPETESKVFWGHLFSCWW